MAGGRNGTKQMTFANERIASAIDRRWPEYIELLTALVRQSTTLGHERGAQEIVFRHMRHMGLVAELYDLDLEALGQNAQFAPTAWSYQDRPNVSAVWKGNGAK
jgi:hypothetical protein